MYKQMFTLLLAVAFLSISSPSFAQVDYTANDQVKPFGGDFGMGVNTGYYEGWNDFDLADLIGGNRKLKIEGVGGNTARLALTEKVLEDDRWDYDIKVGSYKHFKQRDVNDHIVFVGYPSDAHRDKTTYDGKRSELFSNLYEPIWDGGKNGTPYNDDNYYAAYLYKTVSIYKDYIKTWEIWNEPDLTSSRSAYARTGQSGSWWDVNPNPADIAITAPIQHYVRMLRISWEVVKTVDPNAYVAIGGIGYPSFLDAVLRNTDNPKDGNVTDDYPLGGGAYFDVLSYHVYPHMDNSIRKWNNKKGDFDYTRTSDAALKGVFTRKNDLNEVLVKRGYNGKKYPAKEWIISEYNVPRLPLQHNFGSDELQRNFLIKMVVEAQKQNIRQMHIYNLADKIDESKATKAYDEINVMGLYKNVNIGRKYEQELTGLGKTFQAINKFLSGYSFDRETTAQLDQIPNVEGGVFKNRRGQRVFVLWAETTQDLSEKAAGQVDLSNIVKTSKLMTRQLFGKTTTTLSKASFVDARKIQLSGEPSFYLTGASR
ncbi:MAG: hypothetical protein AAGI23_10730 [Bacteroidota bacterium]